MAQPQEKTAEITAEQPELAHVVLIKPGSAAEKSVKTILPQGLENAPIEKIIEHCLGRGDLQTSYARIAERIRTEMKGGQYGITVNETTVKGDEQIGPYFVEESMPDGTAYKKVEIIIANKQEGGPDLYSRLSA